MDILDPAGVYMLIQFLRGCKLSFKVKDHYYKKAKKEKFVARSIFKLEEIDQKFRLLKKSDFVVDFGYYPGSWIQYTTKKITEGQIRGIDIQPVNPKLAVNERVKLYQMDIFDIQDLSDVDVDRKFDIVLSDMAPKTTGIKMVDQAKSIQLVEKVFDILPTFLVPGGHFVIKVFDSNDAQQFLKSQKKRFESFNYLKPKSTRDVSKEFFVIGKSYIE